MSFVLLTFVLTLTLVLGGYWGLVVCPGRSQSGTHTERARSLPGRSLLRIRCGTSLS